MEMDDTAGPSQGPLFVIQWNAHLDGCESSYRPTRTGKRSLTREPVTAGLVAGKSLRGPPAGCVLVPWAGAGQWGSGPDKLVTPPSRDCPTVTAGCRAGARRRAGRTGRRRDEPRRWISGCGPGSRAVAVAVGPSKESASAPAP